MKVESRIIEIEHKVDKLQEEYNLINEKLDEVIKQQQEWMNMLNQGKGAMRLLVTLSLVIPGFWAFIVWATKHVNF